MIQVSLHDESQELARTEIANPERVELTVEQRLHTLEQTCIALHKTVLRLALDPFAVLEEQVEGQAHRQHEPERKWVAESPVQLWQGLLGRGGAATIGATLSSPGR